MPELSFGSLRLRLAPTVYEPAEDSFLLATYASSLAGKILDMGTGSGIAALSAAKASPANNVLGVDINESALECAKANANFNNASNCSFYYSNLFSGISGSFDAILFNPPYLPTTHEERMALGAEDEDGQRKARKGEGLSEGEAENAAYDGGASGMDVTEQFIPLAASHLNSGGKLAIIATSLCEGIEKTEALLSRHVGKPKILAEESFFFEKLVLLEAVKE